MEYNKDEAARVKSIVEAKLEKNDIVGAKKFALKAQTLYPKLDGISKMLMTIDVYISSEKRINGEVNWYGVLGVAPTADEKTIKKQYRKMALMLHPDKNNSAGADGAFKLISQAATLLMDKEKRSSYDLITGLKGPANASRPNPPNVHPTRTTMPNSSSTRPGGSSTKSKKRNASAPKPQKKAAKVYYVYGFMLFVFVILFIVAVCVTIVGRYLLNAYYHWQWPSFFSAASTALYVYLFSIHCYVMMTKLSEVFQTSFYSGYTLLFYFGLGIICGDVGCLGFNYHWQWPSFFSAASTALYVHLFSIYFDHMTTKMSCEYTLIFCFGLGIIRGVVGCLVFNYHWQWPSFFSAALTALYVYLFSIHCYLTMTKVSGFFQRIICGAVACLGFNFLVRRIYRNIMCD